MAIVTVPIKQIQEFRNVMVDKGYSKTKVCELSGMQINTITAILEGKNEFTDKTAKRLRIFLQRQSRTELQNIKYKNQNIILTEEELEKLMAVKKHTATYKDLSQLTGLTTSMLYGLIGKVITEVSLGDYKKIVRVIDLTYPELQELALDKDIELETDRKKFRSKTKLELGARYKFISKDGRGNGLLETFIATPIQEYDRYYLMDTGNYRTCITKGDILAKEYDIKRI